MRRILILTLSILMLINGVVLAAQSTTVGDAYSLDTEYKMPFNVNLEEWFATHPIEQGKMLRMEPIFKSPRVMVMAAANKGQLIDLHYHTSCDEIVFAISGKCEQYVDGKWVVMQAGDLHFNPRGVIHATRVIGDEPFLALSYFTPPPTGGNDRVFLNSGKTSAKPGDVIGDPYLLDTQFKKGVIINLDQWIATHPIPEGQTMRSDFAVGTPRVQVNIGQVPKLGTHYHGSADEIIYIYKGVGELYVDGEWVKVTAGTIHFNSRGLIHGIRPVTEDFQIFAVFAPPQAAGNDRIWVDQK
ncbi:MAG: cupin domain-containing protein [Negativicutes bacterium]|nr:cupin domain-containing protein [Negativicutes bacterium]